MSRNGETQLVKQDFEKVLERLGRGADASTVYGEPTVVGNHAVIPVARVHYMGGGGLGSGTGPGYRDMTEGEEVSDELETAGEGMGLGINVSARPVGVIDVTADSVRWSPAMDWARLANVAAMATGIITVMWTAKRLLRSA